MCSGITHFCFLNQYRNAVDLLQNFRNDHDSVTTYLTEHNIEVKSLTFKLSNPITSSANEADYKVVHVEAKLEKTKNELKLSNLAAVLFYVRFSLLTTFKIEDTQEKYAITQEEFAKIKTVYFDDCQVTSSQDSSKFLFKLDFRFVADRKKFVQK